MQDFLRSAFFAHPFFSFVFLCVCSSELEDLVSGGGSNGSKLLSWDWSIPKLRSSVKFKLGYSPDSTAIGFLLQILSQFDAKQQRAFTRFITGSPSLPGGQIAALNPPLTVVKIELKENAMAAAIAASKAEAAVEKQNKAGTTATAVDLTSSPTLTSKAAPSASAAAPSAAAAPASTSHLILPTVMTCSHYLKVRHRGNTTSMRN